MGMFDTFYGSYTCKHCRKEVDFEEQTKDYDNCLLDFKMGDYIDRGKRSYFYNFTYECPECHAETELSIGIKNGQYVDVFYAEDVKAINPEDLENIEEGLQRRLEYDKKCGEKLGYEKIEGTYEELIALKPGDTITVLRTTWVVLEAYFVKYDPGKFHMLHHPTMVYRVEAEGIKRLITVSINPFTNNMYYNVCIDNLESLSLEESLKESRLHRYGIDDDCKLEPVLNGGSVWNSEDGLREMECQILISNEMLADGDGNDAVNDDFIETYIKSPEVKELVRKNAHIFSDADKATIIYNSDACLKKKYLELMHIADTTTDNNLKQQINDRIDHDLKALRQFNQFGGGFIYQLLVKEDGEMHGYGFFRDAGYAIRKGKETEREFKVEKHQILQDGLKVHMNRTISSPVMQSNTQKRVNEFYIPGLPIAAVDFDSSKKLVSFFSDELSVEEELKVNGFGNGRFEGAYVVIPNPYDKGDKVRVIGTNKIGKVSISQEEWEKCVKNAQKLNSINDWSDTSIMISYSDGSHDHINPIYLETVND